MNEQTSRYTLTQMSRILGIAQADLRKWMRHGLLQPNRIVNRLSWFDFSGLSYARHLQQLVEAGLSIGQIKKTVRDLSDRFPDQVLTRIEPMYSVPIFRTPDGLPSESSGQLMLSFDNPQISTEAAQVLDFPAEQVDQPQAWFRQGVLAEDDGDLEKAEKSYLRALLAGGPDAETCFNLGNVLYRGARYSEAVQRYLQAVEIDPDYVEAWNNLGVVLGTIERWSQSVEAFKRAVTIDPHYGDAHFNLADTLEQLDRCTEARRHWQAYLAEDPDSELAGDVKRRLERI